MKTIDALCPLCGHPVSFSSKCSEPDYYCSICHRWWHLEDLIRSPETKNR